MVLALLLALASPADWVSARWNWTEPASLDLLKNTPINCLLINWTPSQAESAAAFAARAFERGIATLAVLYPKSDAVAAARQAVRAHLNGIVLDGEFPAGTAARVRDAIADAKAIVIELTSRRSMDLSAPAPILGTYQGVWAGIQVMEDGHAKSGPSGSAWIDTNGGFIRAVRAWTDAPLWLGNLPPPKSLVTAERYLQVICDAAMVGARWVLSIDDDFAGRLKANEEAAVKSWARIAQHLKFMARQKNSWVDSGSGSLPSE